MTDVVILVPPSEGKAPGGGTPRWRPGSGRFGRALGPMRTQVAGGLNAIGGGNARLLGVGGAHLERAQAANLGVIGAPTLAAWERFTGVVWDHFDPGGLNAADPNRASQRVVVVSALAGLSGLDDPLPDHRLKLSVRLSDLGKLSTWWRPKLSDVLARATPGALVVDLLPAEHAAALDPTRHDGEWLRIDLVDDAGRRAGHAAKQAKGLLIRQLVGAKNRRHIEALVDGNHRVGGFGVQLRHGT